MGGSPKDKRDPEADKLINGDILGEGLRILNAPPWVAD
jgi:hypothetical protein